jgi:hypothetical protein
MPTMGFDLNTQREKERDRQKDRQRKIDRGSKGGREIDR